MTTILLILAAQVALILIGVGVFLEWRRRFDHLDWTPQQQTRRKVRFMGLAFPALIVVVGPLILIAGAYHQMRYEESLEWPTTTGQITANYIFIQYSRFGTTYSPDPSCTYTVNNQIYHGAEYSYDRREYRDRSDAEDDLRAHPEGSTVTVRYNPDNPQQAYMALTPDSYFQQFTLIGLLVTLGGILFLGIAAIRLWQWDQRHAPQPTVIAPLGK
jgi:hypothetical protein